MRGKMGDYEVPDNCEHCGKPFGDEIEVMAGRNDGKFMCLCPDCFALWLNTIGIEDGQENLYRVTTLNLSPDDFDYVADSYAKEGRSESHDWQATHLNGDEYPHSYDDDYNTWLAENG